jgi:CRISPR-associated endonuclease/helicase Cas3
LGWTNDGMTYYWYWGKARHEGTYHLLPYHCLDVAAVGWLLMDSGQSLCRRLAAALNVKPEWLRHWFAYCLMLHDIGKFARAFQNLAPDLSLDLVPGNRRCFYRLRHDTLGGLLWRTRLARILNHGANEMEPWIEVVCGHHGFPPERNRKLFDGHFMEEDITAASEYLNAIEAWWSPDPAPLEKIDKAALKWVSWQLAGVAVLADWLGSDREIFSYVQQPMELPDYWTNIAQPSARKALDLAEWNGADASPFSDIREQFPYIEQPTPLQCYAADRPLSEGPQIFILEDMTGAGKTEAAMVLAHRLMASGKARGLYVALPTMATANAMYERLAKSYRALFSRESTPSLILAHGSARLSDGFVETISLAPQGADRNYQSDEISASAYCNAWLADSRKKALLADVGVGTVDQALLGVLPARHQSLRLLGLADKVLLVDEVHAYDPYMKTLLVALLEMHSRQGGSAILLSATLPKSLRHELLGSFAKGLEAESPELRKTDYPLATHFPEVVEAEQKLASRERLARRIEVERLDSEAKAISVIRKAAGSGLAVCWIRNTVGDARSAYQTLKEAEGIDAERLTLFHSRFAMIDRLAIEGMVTDTFGKRSDAAKRKGRILIATQVVEQSLDLDFDLLVTDLAPVDLLIQRAGRLHRHARSAEGDPLCSGQDRRSPPRLYLVAPDPGAVADEQWLKRLLPGTQAVYKNVGQLWLSLDAMLERAGFAMPGDARRLIEGVYADGAMERIPEVLQGLTWEAYGASRSQQGMGTFNRLQLEKGYTRASGEWDEEVRYPTRLEEVETVSVALARVVEGGLVPYADTDRHPWEMSRINLPEPEWHKVQERMETDWQSRIEMLKAEKPELRWCQILPLTDVVAPYYDAAGGWNWNGRECREFDE